MEKKPRRELVVYLQIAVAVVSLLLGLAQMTKESQPIVQKIQENQRQQEAAKKAGQIASMNINWQYRGNDGTWRYYSDPTGRYWARVDIQGVYQYCESYIPQIASNPQVVR